MSELPIAPSISDISARAAEYPFGRTVARIFLTSLLAVFFSAGWLLGALWFSVVFVTLWTWKHLEFAKDTAVYGFRTGAHAKTTAK